MPARKWQFSIGQLALAMFVVAALLGWWKVFGFAWIGPFALALATFVGFVALVDATPQKPLQVAQFFGGALGLQGLIFFVAALEHCLFLVFPLYMPIYWSLSAFDFSPGDFRKPQTALWVQTGLGIFSYTVIATGAWAWLMGYAKGEV